MTFRPTLWSVLPPALLIVLAIVPILPLRYTLYSVLALPLQFVIERLDWVYLDKPGILTHPAAILAAFVWAPVLYVLLCLLRERWRA